MTNKYTWNDEKAAERIREVGDEDTPPTKEEFRKEADLPVGTIMNQFGSWRKAVEAAGYDTPPIEYDREYLIEKVNEIADGDTPPSSEEFLEHEDTPTLPPVYKRFDTWGDFLNAAGFHEDTTSRKKWTKEDLIEQIKLVAEENGGKRPSSIEFREHPETTNSTVVAEYFGSWNDAVEAAGFERSHQNQYTREEVIEQIQDHVDEHGKDNVSSSTFNDNDNTVSLTVIRRLFGNWSNAFEGAGYTPQRKWTEASLQQDLEDYAREGGEMKLTDFIDSDYGPKSYAPIRRLFDDWDGLVAAANVSTDATDNTPPTERDEGGDGDSDHSNTDSTSKTDEKTKTDGGVGLTDGSSSPNNSTQRECTESEARDAIRQCATEQGEPVSTTGYELWSDRAGVKTPSVESIINTFGSWENACSIADIEYIQPRSTV